MSGPQAVPLAFVDDQIKRITETLDRLIDQVVKEGGKPFRYRVYPVPGLWMVEVDYREKGDVDDFEQMTTEELAEIREGVRLCCLSRTGELCNSGEATEGCYEKRLLRHIDFLQSCLDRQLIAK